MFIMHYIATVSVPSSWWWFALFKGIRTCSYYWIQHIAMLKLNNNNNIPSDHFSHSRSIIIFCPGDLPIDHNVNSFNTQPMCICTLHCTCMLVVHNSICRLGVHMYRQCDGPAVLYMYWDDPCHSPAGLDRGRLTHLLHFVPQVMQIE